MAKQKTAFVCNECGSDYAKWQGQCSDCGEWNSITEIKLGPAKGSGRPGARVAANRAGFAGALSEIGLPPSEIPLALLFFNIGVELGQLAVIAGAYLLIGRWAGHRSWYRPLVATPASIAIAFVGAFWLAERTTL